MASIPFIGPAIRHRRPLTGARMIIVASAAAFALFLLWASLAQLDEVTRGQGKVIPSSKLQTITAVEPATVSQILVKSGQEVKKGQLLARLDSAESRQVQAETESLQARVSRLTAEGMGGGAVSCTGTDCAGEEALRNARESAVRSKVAALQAGADQARRDAAEAAGTAQSLQSSLALAQKQVAMLEPLAAKHIVPETDLLDKRREVVDLQGRIAAAREQPGKAMAAVPRPRRPISNSSSRRSTNAARLPPRSRSTRRLCAARGGASSAPPSTASSTTSR